MLEFGLLEGLALTDTSFAGLDVQTMLFEHILHRFYCSGAFGHHRQQNSQNFNMWVGALLDLVDAVYDVPEAIVRKLPGCKRNQNVICRRQCIRYYHIKGRRAVDYTVVV